MLIKLVGEGAAVIPAAASDETEDQGFSCMKNLKVGASLECHSPLLKSFITLMENT